MKTAADMPKKPPVHPPGYGAVGWIILHTGTETVFTVKWKRGDPVASVYPGRQEFGHTTTAPLDTFPVPETGWSDADHIRASARNWYAHYGRSRPRSDRT